MPFDIAWPSGHKETIDAATFHQRNADYRDALVVYHPSQELARDCEVYADLDRTVAKLIARYQFNVTHNSDGVEASVVLDGIRVTSRGDDLHGAIFAALTMAEDEADPPSLDTRIPTEACPRCGDEAWDVYANDHSVPAWCTLCGYHAETVPT